MCHFWGKVADLVISFELMLCDFHVVDSRFLFWISSFLNRNGLIQDCIAVTKTASRERLYVSVSSSVTWNCFKTCSLDRNFIFWAHRVITKPAWESASGNEHPHVKMTRQLTVTRSFYWDSAAPSSGWHGAVQTPSFAFIWIIYM